MTVQHIYDAVMAYDEEEIPKLVRAELEAGTAPDKVLQEGMVAALDTIGERFSEGTLFVPEMLMAAEAVKAGLEILRPILAEAGSEPHGTVVIGTVKGDLHDIGKNLVAMLLEGAGFRIVDLGTDVDRELFIDTAEKEGADIIAISGLLTTSMMEIDKAVRAITKANQTRNLNIKVMVGGPPVNQDFASKIGANGYGEDAPGAVDRAREFTTH
jgi:5-methyltetrahydrofolate--homocysteine methyltransferase